MTSNAVGLCTPGVFLSPLSLLPLPASLGDVSGWAGLGVALLCGSSVSVIVNRDVFLKELLDILLFKKYY